MQLGYSGLLLPMWTKLWGCIGTEWIVTTTKTSDCPEVSLTGSPERCSHMSAKHMRIGWANAHKHSRGHWAGSAFDSQDKSCIALPEFKVQLRDGLSFPVLWHTPWGWVVWFGRAHPPVPLLKNGNYDLSLPIQRHCPRSPCDITKGYQPGKP